MSWYNQDSSGQKFTVSLMAWDRSWCLLEVGAESVGNRREGNISAINGAHCQEWTLNPGTSCCLSQAQCLSWGQWMLVQWNIFFSLPSFPLPRGKKLGFKVCSCLIISLNYQLNNTWSTVLTDDSLSWPCFIFIAWLGPVPSSPESSEQRPWGIPGKSIPGPLTYCFS